MDSKSNKARLPDSITVLTSKLRKHREKKGLYMIVKLDSALIYNRP